MPRAPTLVLVLLVLAAGCFQLHNWDIELHARTGQWIVEHGRVVELGTHDELMGLGGRYRTMFDLQARRFGATLDEEGAAYDVLA